MTFSKSKLVNHQLILVTGPARSGKSEWAEHLVAELAAGQAIPPAVTYIATAQLDANDPDWQARIKLHQQRRPPDWRTLAVPVALAATIRQAGGCLLVDSLGSWLANRLDQDEAAWANTAEDLLFSLGQSAAQTVVVAEETGWGVVPAYETGRRFRDRLGKLTRQIGERADAVYLVTGGYALEVSQLGTPLSVMNRSTPEQAQDLL